MRQGRTPRSGPSTCCWTRVCVCGSWNWKTVSIRMSIVRIAARMRIAASWIRRRPIFTGWPIGRGRRSTCGPREGGGAAFDLRTAEGRVAGFQFLLPAIQRLPDKIERVAVANDVAGYLGVDAGLVLENFRKAAMDRRDKKVAPVREPLRADEKILLNLLVSDAEACHELIPDLERLPALEQFATRRIFKALFTLHASGTVTY